MKEKNFCNLTFWPLNQRKPLNVSFLAIAKKQLVLQSRNIFFFLFQTISVRMV